MENKKTNARKTGIEAENAVAAELETQGFFISARNYHSRYGEIDIIAEKGDLLVFVEVKCRKNAVFGTPAEAVTTKKQQKIIKTAMTYLMDKDFSERSMRFDIAEVYGTGGNINIIEGAFDLTSAEFEEDCI